MANVVADSAVAVVKNVFARRRQEFDTDADLYK